jgi:hypothetical protein
MDLLSARKMLSGPLKFGDPEQIKAVQFIFLAESCLEAIKACTHGSGECAECDGDGTCPHCSRECDECEGTGIYTECSCLDEFDGDAMTAALEIQREKNVSPTESATVRITGEVAP